MSTLFSARRRALALAVAASVALGSFVGGSSAAFADAPAPTSITTTSASTIDGDVRVGSLVTAHPGVWDDGVALTYQWLIDGTPIIGADHQTYEPVPADANHKLSVDTTGTLGETTDTEPGEPSSVALGILTSATPTITGTATVFKTLTVHANTWEPSALSFSYRWYRGSAPISGATRSTYTLTPSDAGRKISAHVSGRTAGYVPAMSPSDAVVPKLATFSRIPSTRITGSATVTKWLSANHGTWPYSGVKFTYHWYKNGVAIPGATKSTLQLPISTAGKKITVVVKGSKAGYASLSKRSASVTPKLMHFTSAPAPTISGSAVEGGILTGHKGTWAPGGATFSYRWYRNGVPIAGATGTSYKVTIDDVWEEIRFVVKARKAGYVDGRTVSAFVEPDFAPITYDPTPVDSYDPGGATALCNDGTLSYAAHHQGACSHHGGVAIFYN